MNVLFLAAAVLSGIHGYTFCLWLRKNGNNLGAYGVCILVFFNLALPIYRIISAG